MATELHPWLATPEAFQSAQKAVQIPLALMGAKAAIIGADELLSEALIILAECAIPTTETVTTECAKCKGSLANARKGAKFCSRECKERYKQKREHATAKELPATPAAHIGSMWRWPETERSKWAIREVGYCLNNYLRSCIHAHEIPAGEALARMNVATPDVEATARERVEEYLEAKGIKVEGTESFDLLCEAAMLARDSGRDRAIGALGVTVPDQVGDWVAFSVPVTGEEVAA